MFFLIGYVNLSIRYFGDKYKICTCLKYLNVNVLNIFKVINCISHIQIQAL